jgi:hypothetical protein
MQLNELGIGIEQERKSWMIGEIYCLLSVSCVQSLEKAY